MLTAPETAFSWNEDDGAVDRCAPWLFDADGNPVRLPAEAIGFRARYWPFGSHGLGELVRGRDGLPLFLRRVARPEEFRDLVDGRPGKYKLAAIDQSYEAMPRVRVAVVVINEDPAAKAAATAPAPPAAPGLEAGGVVAQLLTLVSESQRQASTQTAQIITALADILRAAGDSGTVAKTTAIAAAVAGAPVTVQQVVPAANGNAPLAALSSSASSTTATPRNTAGGVTAAAAEKGGFGEAALSLLVPLMEKAAPVAAYGLAQKLDVPEEVARDLAGLVKATTQVAGAMLKGDDSSPATTPANGGAVEVRLPLAGGELLAHVVRIQSALSEDDRAWVLGQMAKRRDLVDAFKPSVASLSVDEGVRAVASLRAMDAALTTTAERACFDRLLQPDLLPQVFHNLFVTSSPEAAIAAVRAQAEQVAAGA